MPEMKVAAVESFEEFLVWYGNVYIPAMVNGSNIPAARMEQNSAVVVDAVFSYQAWRKIARAGGVAFCPSCRHAAHPDLVCGFRALRNEPACMCTAMDSGPKSSSWWLRPIPDFWLSRPLYLVVWALGLVFVGFVFGWLSRLP